MYDVYTNGRDLLVVPRGQAIPASLAGIWRKKKRIARSVSATIRDNIRHYGYYHRKLVDKSKQPVEKAEIAGSPQPETSVR